MSPLASFDIEGQTVSDTNWMPFIPSTTSMSSRAAQEALPDLAPSRSFLSASYSQDQGISDSMPSWPSSILCRPELPHSSSSYSHIQDRISDKYDSPGSLISDKATESSVSPPVRNKLTPRSQSSPDVKSSLTLENAPQVDEFGRIILTEHPAVLEGRQVRFKDTTTFMSAPRLFNRGGEISTSTSSKDTFGNKIEPDRSVFMTSSSDAIVGDSSLAFDLQPGTPLLLDCEPMQKYHDVDGRLPLINDSPIFCFPALCQAVTALSPSSNRLYSLATDHQLAQSSKTLMSPIELDSEKLQERFTKCPQFYRQDFHFEPWRSCRRISISASKSDDKLSQHLQGQRKLNLSRSRSEANINIGKDWNFPNPHASVNFDKVKQQLVGHPCPLALPREDHTIGSFQESNATVRAIMDQQRIAMEKLAQAGFWQQKSGKKTRQGSVKKEEENDDFASLPQEEIVSKVSLWAWLLSSEAEKGEGEEEEEEPMIRSTSPIDWQSDDEENLVGLNEEEKKDAQEVASKSWEWLVSDDDFLQNSFESAETIQEVAIKNVEIGLGLQQSQGIVPDQIVEESKAVPPTVKSAPQLEDSPVMTTPDLGQRESRTSAAIEALLTQVQKSQEPPVAAPRNNPIRRLGASYLYQQILNKISEEEDRSNGVIL